MFDLISQGFQKATLKIKGKAHLSEENISEALDAVRKSLLDADVDYNVTKQFLANVKEKCLGEIVQLKAQSGQKTTAGNHFIKICHNEIQEFLGGEKQEIVKNPSGPTVILMLGLQGAGKTTQSAKLAKLFTEKHAMRPLLVAADVYRPAAREQLKILGEKINVPVFTLQENDPVKIGTEALDYAREHNHDLVILDTAGRLAIDEPLMQELETLKSTLQPQNTLLVVDAMIGQDAVRTASVFHDRLNLSGFILTKFDGDTRGGAALSIKKVTGKSILFVGMGEGLDRLEEFRPEGMASRILGMGDVVGLMEDFERTIDKEDAEKQAGRLVEGKFDFNDFLEMMGSVQKMGPVKDLMAKTPLAGQMSEADLSKVNDKDLVRKVSIVQSMTKKERTRPELLMINKSQTARHRIARIAQGSAHTESDVKKLIEQFQQMQGMVKMMGGLGLGQQGGLSSKIPGLGQLKKMSQMAKMAKMMGGGGMSNPFGGGGSPFGEQLPSGGGQGLNMSDIAEINRLKKRKKAEKMRKKKKR